jgi:UDP-apiose/xylose synthase
MSSSSAPSPASGRVDLDGAPVAPLTICMIGAGGFIGSHLCEKLMAETSHTVLAVDVYCDKIRHLVDPAPPHLAGRISFHRLNIKNDSRLEGLIKMADLTINLAAICTPADYNTRPLDTIYSNFIDALPVVRSLSHQPIPSVIIDAPNVSASRVRALSAGQVLLGEQQAPDPLLHV